jgi:hypothetical protein
MFRRDVLMDIAGAPVNVGAVEGQQDLMKFNSTLLLIHRPIKKRPHQLARTLQEKRVANFFRGSLILDVVRDRF